jgi:hypothetical protein
VVAIEDPYVSLTVPRQTDGFLRPALRFQEFLERFDVRWFAAENMLLELQVCIFPEDDN